MKNKLLKSVAITSALTMALPLFAGCKNEEQQVSAQSYVSVDINPSVSFTLDEENKVLSFYAANEDAQIMLYGEEFKGLSIEAALEKLASLSVELDFVNEENYGVSVSVSGKIGQSEVEGTLEAAFDKESQALDVNVSGDATFTEMRMLESIKAVYSGNIDVQNLTVEQYQLIVDAQAMDGSLTIEEAVKMKTDELMQIVAEGAQKIEPYATNAYNVAMGVAQRAYEQAKGQLLDAFWMAPYTKDLANILTGNRKYDVNNGLLYNMYTASSRALGAGIAIAEAAQSIAAEMQVPQAVIDGVAEVLNLTAEQKQAFVEEITEDGKVTLISLEAYLNRCFKNLTEEQRAQLEVAIEQVIEEVQVFAAEVDAAIADEYKAAIKKIAEDISAVLPGEEMAAFLQGYFNEFKTLIAKIDTAADKEEPLAALKGIKEVFDEQAEVVMGKMRAELTQEDLSDVEKAINNVSATLKGYEDAFASAKAKAEAEAKAWLEQMKNGRKQA